jgi:RNA polymerase sigma factor (sigma-70 family)
MACGLSLVTGFALARIWGGMMDSDPRSDAELLLATSEDVEAFGVFYRRHVDWVVGFLAARSGNAELAADLTSEVFAAALLASGRFDPARGAANSWLYGIVAHKLASAGRRGEAERRARRRLGMADVRLDPEDIDWIESQAANHQLPATELLAALPADQRDLLTARVIDDRPYHELAREHQMTEAAIRKRVSRGLASLRSRLTEGRDAR